MVNRLLIIFLLSPFLTQGQTVTLPTWLVDSLIFEAAYSRQCTQVITAQKDELEKQGVELLHTSKALELSQSESKTLSSLVLNAKEGQRIEQRQFNLDKDVLKRKIRKRNILIVGQTALIIILGNYIFIHPKRL